MTEKVIRMRMPEEIYIKYKVLCAELDLSLPKQTAQLISQFIQVQKDNAKIQRNLRKMGNF